MTQKSQGPALTGAPLAAAGEPTKANSTTMVVVCCKLPNGIILEMGKLGDDNYTQVRLNGSNSARVVGGFGLTDVSKEFWDAWRTKNARLDFVKRGFVCAYDDEASAKDASAAMGDFRTGLEPLDPLKADPRIKGILGPNGKPLVETDMNHLLQGQQDLAQARRAAR